MRADKVLYRHRRCAAVAEFWQNFLAAMIGIGPAFAVFYFSLRVYDRPYFSATVFDSRRVFLALAIGLVFGFIAAAVNLFSQSPGGTLASVLIVLFLIAVFEEGFKLVFLNRKGYRARFDTTYVGLALGVGIAGSVAFTGAYASAPGLGSVFTSGSLLVYAIALTMVHAFTGSLIGFGCAFGETMGRFVKALIVRGVFLAASIPLILFQGGFPTATTYVSLLAILFIGIVLHRFTIGEILPDALPEKLRRERRKRRVTAARASR